MDEQPFDWSEYLKLAVELSQRADEASMRSAMSRAYYYIYHLAFERAKQNGFTTLSGEGTHTQVWRNYGASPDPDCKKLALIAGRMKEKRERADYNSHYPRLAQEIPFMIADANDFAQRLVVLPSRFPSPTHRG